MVQTPSTWWNPFGFYARWLVRKKGAGVVTIEPGCDTERTRV